MGELVGEVFGVGIRVGAGAVGSEVASGFGGEDGVSRVTVQLYDETKPALFMN